MSSTATSQQLATRIDAFIADMQHLTALLAREREALLERTDAAALEQIAAHKQTLIEQIGAHYQFLQDACGQLAPADEPRPCDVHNVPARDLHDAPAGHSIGALRRAHPSLAERIERLVEITRACKQANQDNGVTLSAGLHSAQRALQALHGVPATDTSDIYGPAGRAGVQRYGTRVAITA